jgi:uncharacterized protein (TIGR02722 family)
MLKKLILISSALLAACAVNAPTVGRGKVSYGDVNAVETINSDFGSTDINMVSQQMATRLIASAKLNNCKTYTVSQIRNKTDQYIDTENITQSVVDKLSNAPQIQSVYVVSNQEMQNQVDELNRQNQTGLYKTRAKKGQMLGAECRIDGFVSNITKDNGDIKNVFYIFSMKLINIEEGSQLWSDEKQISKNVVR